MSWIAPAVLIFPLCIWSVLFFAPPSNTPTVTAAIILMINKQTQPHVSKIFIRLCRVFVVFVLIYLELFVRCSRCHLRDSRQHPEQESADGVQTSLDRICKYSALASTELSYQWGGLFIVMAVHIRLSAGGMPSLHDECGGSMYKISKLSRLVGAYISAFTMQEGPEFHRYH